MCKEYMVFLWALKSTLIICLCFWRLAETSICRKVRALHICTVHEVRSPPELPRRESQSSEDAVQGSAERSHRQDLAALHLHCFRKLHREISFLTRVSLLLYSCIFFFERGGHNDLEFLILLSPHPECWSVAPCLILHLSLASRMLVKYSANWATSPANILNLISSVVFVLVALLFCCLSVLLQAEKLNLVSTATILIDKEAWKYIWKYVSLEACTASFSKIFLNLATSWDLLVNLYFKRNSGK